MKNVSGSENGSDLKNGSKFENGSDFEKCFQFWKIVPILQNGSNFENYSLKIVFWKMVLIVKIVHFKNGWDFEKWF